MTNRKQDAKKWLTMNDAGYSYEAIAAEEGLTKSIIAGAIWRHERAQIKYAMVSLTKKGYTFRDIANSVIEMEDKKAEKIINSLGAKKVYDLDISLLPLLYKLLKEATCTISNKTKTI